METIVNATSDYTCSKIEQEDLGKLIQYESLVAALKLKHKLKRLKEWNPENSTVCEDPEKRRLSTTMIDPLSQLRRKLYGIGGFVYRGSGLIDDVSLLKSSSEMIPTIGGVWCRFCNIDNVDTEVELVSPSAMSEEKFGGDQAHGWVNAKLVNDTLYGPLLGFYEGGQLISKNYELPNLNAVSVEIAFNMVIKGNWTKGEDKFTFVINDEKEFSVWEDNGPSVATRSSGEIIERYKQWNEKEIYTISITIPKSDFPDGRCNLKIIFFGKMTYAFERVVVISTNSRSLQRSPRHLLRSPIESP
eukprot:CAMPEP_0202448366 /NCGR_PEP_ID=MMETSP1360-20130828/7175_1 /ASSEMBLY_ACC=CAM_ASM_000848 /TAXON_ID=515479 /ORGANISM="Licmophora paradoxa, Strain CCMP2313" /LENGTH=301 /DNA_ID=CAMNT_0049065895 /DNA_START=220 /DNA_END=1121 /DNA_ORIENTATION=-